MLEDIQLRKEGLDPNRLVRHSLGWPKNLLWRGYAPWVWTAIFGFGSWIVLILFKVADYRLTPFATSLLSLAIGVIILKSACDALIAAVERLAARQLWNHYVAGTIGEIVSTVPELVVICFVIPVSPLTAMVIALVTIYNNALVFSVYSYFLPKDQKGKFLMPTAITEVGTQLLIAGASIGSVIGLVMLVFMAGGHEKQTLESIDLMVLSVIMLSIFGVYLNNLIKNYASEEQTVQEVLRLNEAEAKERNASVYDHVKRTSLANILFLFFAGTTLALIGGERVSDFAHTAINELNLSPIVAAICLAIFAGMSEYVILWRAHKKRQYGIALANAFGGITQVMFLILPFTLLSISLYQAVLGTGHVDLPLSINLSNMLLFVLLFPTFYVLTALIKEDHTLGALDTISMLAIFLLVILILIGYGDI